MVTVSLAYFTFWYYGIIKRSEIAYINKQQHYTLVQDVLFKL